VIGDASGDGRRAIHGGQNADVVARRDFAVVRSAPPDDALEGRPRLDELRRLCIDAECVVAIERTHRQVVQMHVLARCNRSTREADDLVVAAYRRTGSNRTGRDLVTGRNEPRDGDVLVEQFRTADQLLAGDDDVVRRMQANRQR